MNSGDALDAPPYAEIDFLALPVLDKCNAPQGADNRIDRREISKQHVSREAKHCGKQQESKVCLCKGEVEGDLRRVYVLANEWTGRQAVKHVVANTNMDESWR